MKEPQLECDQYARWLCDIFDSLSKSLHSEHESQMLQSDKSFCWSALYDIDDIIYKDYLNKFVQRLSELMDRLTDKLEKQNFIGKSNAILFALCLRDLSLLCEEDEYYYEPIANLFRDHRLGIKFYSDLVDSLDWSREAGKCIINLAFISDPRNVDQAVKLLVDKFHFTEFRSLTCLYEVIRDLINSLTGKEYGMYLELRLNTFGWLQMGDLDLSLVDLELDRRSQKPIRFNEQMKNTILFIAYIDPLWVSHRIIGEGIQHRQHIIPWIAKLCCEELAPLCRAIGPNEIEIGPDNEAREPTNFIVQLLNYRLRMFSNKNNLDGIIKFINEVLLYYSRVKSVVEKKILTLEIVLKCFIEQGSIDNDSAVWMKIEFFNFAQSLDEIKNEEWIDFQQKPAATIYHLLQFLDFFFLDGSKKRSVIKLLHFLLIDKLQRKLSIDEMKWIQQEILRHDEASLLLAYIVNHSEMNLNDVFNFKTMPTVEIVALAAILGPSEELIDKLEYSIHHKIITKEFVRGALRFMDTVEYINFYMVLTHTKSPGSVIQVLVESAMEQRTFHEKLNSDYVLSSMIALGKHAIEDVRQGHINRSGLKADDEARIKQFSEFLLKLFREFSMFYIGKDFVGHVNQNLMDFLVQIASEIRDLSIDPQVLLNGRFEYNHLPRKALETVFGPLPRESPPPQQIIHIPG